MAQALKIMTPSNTNINKEQLTELIENGVLYGHKKSKTHPRMKAFIFGSRNEIEILHPEKTLESLSQAGEFIKEKIATGGLPLLVATLMPAAGVVEGLAKDFNFPYVRRRWLGGLLTNFKAINERIARYQKLAEQQKSGELGKYTKKEQHQFRKEIEKLSEIFDGLINLKRLPDFLFVVDTVSHVTAIREARKLGIPVVAIIDSDDDPAQIDYPIFASDHTRSSIVWVIEKLKEAIKGVKIEG